MPLVAVIGALTADQIESGINAVLAASGVGLCWMLLARIGVRRLVDRLALTILFGFSTQILWITTRGGVWPPISMPEPLAAGLAACPRPGTTIEPLGEAWLLISRLTR
jgi:hypothetical protein